MLGISIVVPSSQQGERQRETTESIALFRPSIVRLGRFCLVSGEKIPTSEVLIEPSHEFRPPAHAGGWPLVVSLLVIGRN
jgi:hypothetical protein